MEKRLNFVLMGKSGHGKSKTGNSLLDRKAFKASADATSITKEVDYSFGHFGDEYVLLVVDTPSLRDTDVNKARNIEAAAKNMDKARNIEAAAKNMDKARNIEAAAKNMDKARNIEAAAKNMDKARNIEAAAKNMDKARNIEAAAKNMDKARNIEAAAKNMDKARNIEAAAKNMDKARNIEAAAKNMDKARNIEAAAKNMDKALAMCYGGVDAFLFVTRFGCRFLKEDQNTLHDLKRIFGEDYINHIIVVMTGGDSFQKEMEEENDDEENNITFHDWCKKQRGELHKLYKDCNGRFVLFNNFEKDREKMKAQIQEIVRLASDLQLTSGRYNSECFENARTEREKMILKLKAPHLTIEIQEKLGLLSADIENFGKTKSSSDKKKIEKGLEDLKKEIEIEDKGYGELDHLKHLVEKVRRNLNDQVELQSLGEKIESARAAKGIWASLETVFAGDVLALAAPPFGLAVAAISTAAGAIGFGTKHVEENKSEKEKKEVEERKKKK